MNPPPSGPPAVSFNIAFERLKDLMSKDDNRAMASTTMEDVWTSAREIEHQLEMRRSLRSFRRIQPFLNGIEQYSKVVEVVCNGTPYLPYLWAPIKLILQIAQTHISSLERLIDAYAMIGEAMPRFDKLSGAFKDDTEFLQVMAHFYEDILEFHRRAYKFFRRRAWKIVFESLWKTFDSRFQAILQSLRKHRDLIDQEASTIDIVEAKVWRSQQLEQIRQWRAERSKALETEERERLNVQIREAVVWFGAAQEQEDILARILRACDGTAGHWALQEPVIVSWLEQSRDNQFLWLHGKPGAGKSVICAKLVEHVQDATDGVVIFYFCSHQRTSSSLANDMLRNFVTQLLAANTELAPYILDTFANQALTPTKKILGAILEKLITSLSSVKVVVDGLDECAASEQEEIIGDLLKIKGSVPGACKVLLSCRKVPSIFRLLRDKPTIRLDDYIENVKSTISSFVHQRLGSLRQNFDSAIIDDLEGEIMAKANGMFLWVKLVMFTLEDLHFESDVREATQRLPEGLEAVYERILSRICGDSKAPNHRTATRILQWMLVARRPLKRYEIESGIILDERISQITNTTRPRGDVLSCCYPIIDVEGDPSGYVKFCHFTALEYLRTVYYSPPLQYSSAQLAVSLACVLYLVSSLDLVDPRFSGEEKRSKVGQCLHDLQFYANDYWLDHLSAIANSPTDFAPDEPSMRCLSQGLEHLTQRHNELVAPKACNAQDDRDPPRESLPVILEKRWPCLRLSPATRCLLHGVSDYRSKSMEGDHAANIISDFCVEEDPTQFSNVRTHYQSILEELLACNNTDDMISGDFTRRYHSGSYFCRYRSCPRASEGFNSANLRQEHESSHVPQFRCTDPACRFLGKTLKDRAAMNRHNKRYHGDGGLTSIPTSLRRSSALPQQDRSRFLLKETSSADRKRSFHTTGDDDVMSEVEVARDLVPHVNNIRPSRNKPRKKPKVTKNLDRDGRTLLARACARDDAVEVKKWLEARPEDIDVPDNFGNTPLQIASLTGATEIVQLLLSADCKITCRNINGDTPLIYAVECGHLEVVKLLVKAGMDPGEKNAQGKEPLELVPLDWVEAESITDALLGAKSAWDSVDHVRALIGLHGTDWGKIARILKTRNATEIQYYYEEAVANGDAQLERHAAWATSSSFPDYQKQLMLLEQKKKKRQLILFKQQKRNRDRRVDHAASAPGAAMLTSSASSKKTFQAVQNDKTSSEIDVGTEAVPSIEHRRPSTEEDKEEYRIKCICGFDQDDGNTVFCELCSTWQHTECYFTDKHGSVPTTEELANIDHFCVDCRPRWLDSDGARRRQRIRQVEIDDPARSQKKKRRRPQTLPSK